MEEKLSWLSYNVPYYVQFNFFKKIFQKSQVFVVGFELWKTCGNTMQMIRIRLNFSINRCCSIFYFYFLLSIFLKILTYFSLALSLLYGKDVLEILGRILKTPRGNMVRES